MEGSKQPIRIGVGKIDFFTYYLTIRDESKNILWEGTINGKPFKGPDGLPALQPEEIPRKLSQALQKHRGVYYSEWKPAWEVIEPEQLQKGEDGDNQTSSQED